MTEVKEQTETERLCEIRAKRSKRAREWNQKNRERYNARMRVYMANKRAKVERLAGPPAPTLKAGVGRFRPAKTGCGSATAATVGGFKWCWPGALTKRLVVVKFLK